MNKWHYGLVSRAYLRGTTNFYIKIIRQEINLQDLAKNRCNLHGWVFIDGAIGAAVVE